jgi:hypothetical protein
MTNGFGVTTIYEALAIEVAKGHAFNMLLQGHAVFGALYAMATLLDAPKRRSTGDYETRLDTDDTILDLVGGA